MRQGVTSGSNVLWLAANGLSLIVLSMVLFRLQAPVTFFRFDGTFILTVVKNQAQWMPGLGVFTMDFLKGMGDLWFPIDTRFMPGFIIGRLGGGDGNWLPAISDTWFALEFAVATLLIGRIVDLPLAVGILAAWLGVFGALPYLVPTPVLQLTWGNPHFISFIAFTMLSLALFLALGRGSQAKAITSAAGILLVLFYLSLIGPILTIMFLPVLGFFGVVGIIMADNRRERLWKINLGLAIVLLYLLIFSAWLLGFFLYAKTTFFWSEMYPSTITWQWVSLLLESPDLRPAGVLFFLMALVGGVLTAFGSAGRIRRFAIGYLLFVALLLALTGFLIVTQYRWPGPTIAYFDLMIYPLHALFAAQCLYQILLRVPIGPRLKTARSAFFRSATIFLPWAALAVWVPPYEKPMLKNQNPYRWPPLRTPIVEFLEREIALRPGQPFRGRVVNLAGGSFDPEFMHVPYINQHMYDSMVAFFLGNDHREYGFSFYDVPTLDDSNNLTSPFLHFLMSRLLNPERSLFLRAHETATLFKPKILAQLGVRYVLTEEPLPGRTPARELELVAGRKQYLYELEEPNVSGRAVTRVTVARTAAEALAYQLSPDFDYHNDAVVFDSLPYGNLVQVSRSRLDVYRGYLKVSAEAAGRALLVLPVEFSQCLEFRWEITGAESPVAVRVNLDQTAVLFQDRLEGRIALRYGPFTNPTCRLRDLEDALRVQLGDVN